MTTTTDVPGQAPDIFSQTRALVEPALRDAIDRLHTDLARVASYHTGWVTASGEPVATGGGKRLRPALALLSALSAGAAATVAVPGAVAIELLHEFSLLHDDIIDGDRTRRGRPAAWTVFGTEAAVLTGDALVAQAIQVLADTERTDLLPLLTDAVVKLCWGQAEDSRFEHRDTVSVAEYISMVEGKTGAFMEFSCTIGAYLAHAPAPLIRGLQRIGTHIGMGFQVADDVLGIWGNPAVTGKPVHSDLARKKKTLPVLAALASPGPAADELRDCLNGDLDDATLALCADLIKQAGGHDRATYEIRWRHQQAHSILAGLRLPPAARHWWQVTIDTLATRVR